MLICYVRHCTRAGVFQTGVKSGSVAAPCSLCSAAASLGHFLSSLNRKITDLKLYKGRHLLPPPRGGGYVFAGVCLFEFFEGFLLCLHPRMSCFAEVCALRVLFYLFARTVRMVVVQQSIKLRVMAKNYCRQELNLCAPEESFIWLWEMKEWSQYYLVELSPVSYLSKNLKFPAPDI